MRWVAVAKGACVARIQWLQPNARRRWEFPEYRRVLGMTDGTTGMAFSLGFRSFDRQGQVERYVGMRMLGNASTGSSAVEKRVSSGGGAWYVVSVNGTETRELRVSDSGCGESLYDSMTV